MILTCPQCATRYQVDGAKFPAAGRNVRCAKCGNVWHQLGPVEEPDPDAEIEVHEPAEPQRPVTDSPAALRAATFPPSAMAQPAQQVIEEPAPWLGRAAVAGGWVLLVVLILVIGWAAIAMRDSIATWLPQTSSLYNAAGLPVNRRGMDFSDVKYERQVEDGQVVLAVTGIIVNRSSH